MLHDTFNYLPELAAQVPVDGGLHSDVDRGRVGSLSLSAAMTPGSNSVYISGRECRVQAMFLNANSPTYYCRLLSTRCDHGCRDPARPSGG